MRKISIFLFLLLIGKISCLAQIQEQEDEEASYKGKLSYGVFFSTNGGLIGGFTLRSYKKLTPLTSRVLSFDLTNIKHPKESRQGSAITGSAFIPGKQNYLYCFRAHYGREFILFQKAPEEGVEIGLTLAGGLNLAFVAPYYIEYAFSSTDIRKVPYDPNVTPDFGLTLGTGNLFQGLTESKIKLGLTAKAAFSFQFASFRESIGGFEVGGVLDAFAQKIVILPLTTNRAIYPAFYLTIFYGFKK